MASSTAPSPNAPLAAAGKKLGAKTLKGREGRTDRALAWLGAFLLLCFVIGLYALSAFKLDRRPSGHTIVGYTLGVITIVLYGVVTAYSFRHRRRVQKRGMTRTWMEVHLAFGFVAGVSAVLHSGPRLGAPINGGFLIAWVLLIATGIIGKMISVLVPRRLTRIEDEALLVEDCVDRQRAMRLEVEQLTADANPKLMTLVNGVIPGKIKSPQWYGKRRMKRGQAVEAVYKEIGGDAAVTPDKKDLLKRLVSCLVEDRFLSQQIRYHYILRAWLPFHVALTTLCLPWLLIHVVTVFLL